MKRLSLALLLLLAAAPALATGTANAPPATKSAQAAVAHGKAFCWYNDDGDYTGNKQAPSDAPVHHRQITGRGGKHAWIYTIDRTNGDHCPQELPG